MTCWRVWQPTKWHKPPCGGPLAIVLWPHEGEGTTPTSSQSFLFTFSCGRSNSRWTKPSPLVLTSRVQTLRLSAALMSLMCFSTVTWLLASVKPGSSFSTVVGRLPPQSLASMLFSLSMAALVSMSSRKKVSGFLTTMVLRFPSSQVCAWTESFLQFFTLTDTIMTESRTVTFTNVQDKVERTVEFPTMNDAMRFVLSLHCAGVEAIVNLLPEDVALQWYNVTVTLHSLHSLTLSWSTLKHRICKLARLSGWAMIPLKDCPLRSLQDRITTTKDGNIRRISIIAILKLHVFHSLFDHEKIHLPTLHYQSHQDHYCTVWVSSNDSKLWSSRWLQVHSFGIT